MIRPCRSRLASIARALCIAPLLAAAVSVSAQPANTVAKIGVLSGSTAEKDICVDKLRQGLREQGYNEGRNYVLVVRRTDGRQDLFPRLADELVKAKPDLIVSLTTDSHLALKHAKNTIPVVMAAGAYPVELGLIASLPRPGGNVTGLATLTPEVMAKRVQILKEAFPGVTRVLVLREPGERNDLVLRDYERAARQFGISLIVAEIRSKDDLAGAFAAGMRSGAQAVMSTQGPFFGVIAEAIASLALKHRLPSVSGEIHLAPEAGILLSFGPSPSDDCARAARYVDRILKGAKPAQLPAEQPVVYETVVNLRTAKALGIDVPRSVLIRATQVIE